MYVYYFVWNNVPMYIRISYTMDNFVLLFGSSVLSSAVHHVNIYDSRKCYYQTSINRNVQFKYINFAGRNVTASVERLVTQEQVITVWKAVIFGIAFVFILPQPSRGNSRNCLNIHFQTMAVWWRRSNWNSWWCGVIKLRQIAREARGGWWRRQQAEARKKFLSLSGM